jgi:hypothetical protein
LVVVNKKCDAWNVKLSFMHVPGCDRADVLDLLQRGDVEGAALGQLLGDQQPLASQLSPLRRVLGAFGCWKSLRLAMDA